jgi:hypothetical protein
LYSQKMIRASVPPQTRNTSIWTCFWVFRDDVSQSTPLDKTRGNVANGCWCRAKDSRVSSNARRTHHGNWGGQYVSILNVTKPSGCVASDHFGYNLTPDFVAGCRQFTLQDVWTNAASRSDQFFLDLAECGDWIGRRERTRRSTIEFEPKDLSAIISRQKHSTFCSQNWTLPLQCCVDCPHCDMTCKMLIMTIYDIIWTKYWILILRFPGIFLFTRVQRRYHPNEARTPFIDLKHDDIKLRIFEAEPTALRINVDFRDSW